MFFSSKTKKQLSPRPLEGEDEGKQRTRSLLSFGSTTPEETTTVPDEAESGTGLSLTATESEEVDLAEEEVEHPEEDKKPFEAATSLLVFHDGQVYVREDREMVVTGSTAVIRDLPTTIDPASLHFHSTTDPDASIVEHTLENVDSTSGLALIDHVGEIVTLRLTEKQGGHIKGKLLQSFPREEVLELEDGSVVMISRANVVGIELEPNSFVKEPTLYCELETDQEGPHKALLTYEASGIQWSAEYTLVLRPDKKGEFVGLISLFNGSGKTFKDAALALVTAPRLESDTRPPVQDAGSYSTTTNNKMKSAFSSLSSFSKKRVKTQMVPTKDTTYVPRPITLVQNKVKQIRITDATFPIEQINLFRKFSGQYKGFYQGAHSDHSMEGASWVDEILRWTNNKATHHRLGVELAGGSLTVVDSVKGDTYMNVLHQTTLAFTRPGEEIILYTGQNSDLVGERKVTELRSDAKTRSVRESVQIEIKNTSATQHQVVVEDLLWRWRSHTVHPCQPKCDSFSKAKQIMTWQLTIAPKSVETIRYSVLYTNVPQV